MIKEIGRLDAVDIKKIEDYIQEIFTILDNGEADNAISMLGELCKTNNYFLRELVGKLLTNYQNQEKMTTIADQMLTNKIYGIRATALFYFFNKNINQPESLMKLLGENYDSVPWEVESIIYELWKKNPKLTREMIPQWINSTDEKKRMISFHGMELIVDTDTNFVLDFLTKAIDDPSTEVQKKITHIVLQLVKVKPAETYPYIREWIMTGSEARSRSLLVTLRKIISLYAQKNQRDKTPDFMMLTRHIVNDWRSDHNRKVARVGQKLNSALKKELSGRK